MAESGMRSKVLDMLKPLDGLAVENPTRPGTPDVNYIEGWIELKWLRNWPKDGHIVLIPHFSQEQRIWLARRRRKGGRAFLLLQVKREWLLFDGFVAAQKVGKSKRQELIESALAYWPHGINSEEFIDWISVSDLPTPSGFFWTEKEEAKLNTSQQSGTESRTDDTDSGNEE